MTDAALAEFDRKSAHILQLLAELTPEECERFCQAMTSAGVTAEEAAEAFAALGRATSEASKLMAHQSTQEKRDPCSQSGAENVGESGDE